jgi:hypothetical protein
MPEREAIAMWGSRLRWRLRGAWMWPTFAVATVADAIVLARLPFSGGRANLLGSFLAAGFLNLVVVAVGARLGGRVLRRRRPALPREIAVDAAGALGMGVLFCVLLVAGLLHRPAVERNDDMRSVAIAAARHFVVDRAPAPYVMNVHRPNVWQQDKSLFRVCVPGDDPRRDFCVFVRTDEPVPIVRRDPDQRPNATVAGPDNPGRSGG